VGTVSVVSAGALAAAGSRGAALAPDVALPWRDALLDADLVAERLSAVLGGDGPVAVAGCRLARAKYRIGESLRVVYHLEVDGVPAVVAARALPGGDSVARYERAARATAPIEPAPARGGLRAVAHTPDLGAVWWTFPNDRRLRGVGDLLAPAPDVAALAQPGPRWARSELVELAPERGVTLRAVDPTGATVAYAKAYAPGGAPVRQLAARYDAVAQGLASRVGLRAPRPLGWSERRRLLVLEAMPGRPWTDLEGVRLPAALTMLGAAVAAMHDLAPVAAVPRFGRLDVGRLCRSAQLVARARPDVAAALSDLVARLVADRPPEDEQVMLHGDCHAKNALVAGPTVCLIDVDQSGTGPAAADVGSLLARLRHGCLLGEHDEAAGRALGEAFLAGYRSIRPLPGERSVQWHTAAAMLAERALRAVSRVNRPALACLGDLASAARSTVRTGGWW
jgi:Ser/Thr protein kinase RdoA (MazF antagonist)